MENNYAIHWQSIDTLLLSDYEGEVLFRARITGKKTVVYQGEIKDNVFLKSSYTHWSPVTDPADVNENGLQDIYGIYNPPPPTFDYYSSTCAEESKNHSILEKAETLINGARKKDYGNAEDMFRRVANFWNSYLEGKAIEESDVGVMMGLFKIARLITSPTHEDSAVDAAAYIALAFTVATIVKERENNNV
jgi:hypothetical protein